MKAQAMLRAVILIIFLVTAAQASDEPAPTELPGGRVIGVEEARGLMGKKGVHFFDVRNAINYGRGHIPGAKLLSYKGDVVKSVDFSPPADGINVKKLPASKDEAIVFYSHGPGGWKSYFASVIAIEAGYRNVMWFRGGYDEWSGDPGEKRSGRVNP